MSHRPALSVRLADADDALQATLLLVRSIRELCVADHHDDPATLERWLSNKHEAQFRGWVADPINVSPVAELEGRLVGVGMLGVLRSDASNPAGSNPGTANSSVEERVVDGAVNRAYGEIRLCYVMPGMQGHGVGRALISYIEERAAQLGLRELRLTSTVGACAFYERLGYVRTGPPRHLFGVLHDYPFAKQL